MNLQTLPALEPHLAALCAAIAVAAWPRPPRPSLTSGPPSGRIRPPSPDRRLTPRRGRRESGAALLAEALAPCLASGLPPAAALRLAVESTPPGSIARECADAAVRAAGKGMPVGAVLQRVAADAGDPDLAQLARAWQVSESLGAPLADAVAGTAKLVRERQACAGRLAAATAGARTSMMVLAALPAAGPVASLLVGVSPASLYRSRISAVAVLIGAGLAIGGLCWARQIVHRASQPEAL
jgi:tight adherence protein B